MPTEYKASALLKAYIMQKEGCEKWDEVLQCFMPYADGGGLATIGYGHLITHDEMELGRFAKGLTSTSCVTLFENDLQRVVNRVNNLNLPNLRQGQFDALVDFTWNCGFKNLQAVLRYGLGNFPLHSIHYVHDAKGNVEPGLVTRRQDEVNWWQQSI